MHDQVYPQLHPWLHCQVDYQLVLKCIIFFTILCIFKCSLKWNLRRAQVQHRELPQVPLFIESFCALPCPEKCTTMRIFKCNSTFTSTAPLISTSNVPSCASVYRSQGTTLGVPSNEPSVESSIALMHLQVHHQLQRRMRPFCHFLMHQKWSFKLNSKVHLQV